MAVEEGDTKVVKSIEDLLHADPRVFLVLLVAARTISHSTYLNDVHEVSFVSSIRSNDCEWLLAVASDGAIFLFAIEHAERSGRLDGLSNGRSVE